MYSISRTSYKIIPLTNWNKYLYYDKSEIKVNININNISEEIQMAYLPGL
jgi:hypothetical protein